MPETNTILLALFFGALVIIATMGLRRSVDRNKQQTDPVCSVGRLNERLTSTINASLDGVITADESGKVIDFSPSAAKIFGWSKDDVVGKSMEETIVPHQFREAHAAGMKRYVASRTPKVIGAGRLELSALRKSGEEFPIELNITSAKQGDGEIFIAYVRDISEQKINEQALIDAKEAAEKADSAKSQFLTVMSHEMRTPLNGMLGVLDLIRTTKIDTQQKRYIDVATASGEILLEHVNEALDITRIETGAMSLSPSEFQLKPVVEHVMEVLGPLAAEKNLTLDLEFDADMAKSFVADAGRINQILTNLIGNAIKFTDDGGIKMAVSGIHAPQRTSCTFTVTDSGRGIEESQLQTIFDDFVVLSKGDGRQSRGDGLGLSISRKVARQMGGDLRAHSKEDTGSTFVLTLPLERLAGRAKSAEPPQSADAVSNVSGWHILIVEDNHINRSVLSDMIVGLGHKVVTAENGLDAIKVCERERFDLIIMDISMPFMDGIEATRRIRLASGPNQSTRILGLTAHGRGEYRSRAQEAGMSSFFTKPIRLKALQSALSVTDESGKLSLPSYGLFDDEVLGELESALGDDKVRDVLDRYFNDLPDALEAILRSAKRNDKTIVASALHKLRGASVLLGLTGITAKLDGARSKNDHDDPAGLETEIEEVRSIAQQSKESLGGKLG